MDLSNLEVEINPDYTMMKKVNTKGLYLSQEQIDILKSYKCSNISSGTSSPKFKYSGKCTIERDENNSNDCKIKFLESGTLKLSNDFNIDAFLVGGGGGGTSYAYYYMSGGGGGGGYTNTIKNIILTKDKEYKIVVGDGGEIAADGKASTAFGYTANGGKKGNTCNGGAGGSGGGAGKAYGGSKQEVAGGTNGSNGYGQSNAWGKKCIYGTGQGRTTCEFAEEGCKEESLYSGGGGAGGYYHSTTGAITYGGYGGSGGGGEGGKGGYNNKTNGKSGTPNTGGGGGGAESGASAGKGGSGIVIIRNAR